jgi:multiple sugar transport system substrate-binding protein
MIAWRLRSVTVLLLLSLAGCSILPIQQGDQAQLATPAPQLVHTTGVSATYAAPATATSSTPGEVTDVPQSEGVTIVRIWVPPEFDPEGNTPASQLLKARLEEFIVENPDIRLEVRVKALDGEGGMLASLVTANAAAPLTLPDLVLLQRPLLESAALKGLIYPFDGLTNLVDDPSWFEYAQQLAHLKSGIYGIPFAGEAMVLANRPSLLETRSYNLEDFLELGEVLLFPAADLQALYTLSQYLVKGGSLQDAEGRPWLDEAILTNILEFYQRASLAGVMPYWLTQYSNDAQVWEAFMGDEFPMAVTWASTYLKNMQGGTDDLAMAPMPVLDDAPFTLASGWCWVLAGQDPEKRQMSVQLAEFLVEPEFLAAWTSAAGYLPPRLDALQNWQNADLRQVIEQISYSAQLIPSTDVISTLGPALEKAVVDVLKAQNNPQTAAQEAADQVNQP